MELTRAFALLWVALLVGACATTGSPEAGRARGNDCFFASTLSDWRPLDDRNLVLFAGRRRPHHVELVRPAMGLTFNVMIGVYDRDGRICPFGGDAIVIDGAIPDRISIRSITALTAEELEVLYAEFGVGTPNVIDATEVDPESSNDE